MLAELGNLLVTFAGFLAVVAACVFTISQSLKFISGELNARRQVLKKFNDQKKEIAVLRKVVHAAKTMSPDRRSMFLAACLAELEDFDNQPKSPEKKR